MIADDLLAGCTIRTPCPMDWDRMLGDDRVRFCAACGKHVYNLTVMSPEETASLLFDLRERGERGCVRLYRRPDGTLTTSGCQPAVRHAARPWQVTIRTIMAVIAGFAAILGLARWLTPVSKAPSPPPTATGEVITGDMF
jgi:hypothetical protein